MYILMSKISVIENANFSSKSSSARWMVSWSKTKTTGHIIQYSPGMYYNLSKHEEDHNINTLVLFLSTYLKNGTQ